MMTYPLITYEQHTLSYTQPTLGLFELSVSSSEADEVRLQFNEFERVQPQEDDVESHLLNYGVPGAPGNHLWYRDTLKTIGSAIAPEELTVNQILVECNRIKKLCDEKPGDETLLKFHKKLVQKLADAYAKEREYQENKKLDRDPLQSTVEFLALNDSELQRFRDHFKKIDKECTGKITLENFFKYIELPLSKFSRSLFTDLDAVDEEDCLEFGDWIKGVSNYCMYGLDEILKSLFVFADKDRLGYVTMAQLTELFFILNPETLEKGRMKSGVIALGIPMNTKITWERFRKMNAELPSVMFAALRLQRDLRNNFMGADFWVAKMIKYAKVRQAVAGSRERTQRLIEMELKRFDQGMQLITSMTSNPAIRYPIPI